MRDYFDCSHKAYAQHCDSEEDTTCSLSSSSLISNLSIRCDVPNHRIEMKQQQQQQCRMIRDDDAQQLQHLSDADSLTTEKSQTDKSSKSDSSFFSWENSTLTINSSSTNGSENLPNSIINSDIECTDHVSSLVAKSLEQFQSLLDGNLDYSCPIHLREEISKWHARFPNADLHILQKKMNTNSAKTLNRAYPSVRNHNFDEMCADKYINSKNMKRAQSNVINSRIFSSRPVTSRDPNSKGFQWNSRQLLLQQNRFQNKKPSSSIAGYLRFSRQIRSAQAGKKHNTISIAEYNTMNAPSINSKILSIEGKNYSNV